VVAGKLLPADVEVHLLLPVEQDLHGPPAGSAACFPQVHLSWPAIVEKLPKLVRGLLLAERVTVNVDDELGLLVVEALRLLFLERRLIATTPCLPTRSDSKCRVL
jgi:hypothetical protein